MRRQPVRNALNPGRVGVDAVCQDVGRVQRDAVQQERLPAAKARAIKLAGGWRDAHRDDMYEAEQAFALDQAAWAERLHVHLKPSPMSGDPDFTCRYTPIR